MKFLNEFVCLFSAVASLQSASAFTTTPRSPLTVGGRNKVGALFTPLSPSSSSSNDHDRYSSRASSSLNFWKKDVSPGEKDSSITSLPIDAYVDETFGDKDDVPLSTIALVGSSLFSFTYVVQRLQIYLNTPCVNASTETLGKFCTPEYYDFSKFFAEHEFLSFMMILTHTIPFVLLPWVSKQISEVGPTIKKDFEEFNPFLMQMAFACIGFGLSLEFGWHVADSWYYENNFHVLNFGFYFFLISGFALWADGFRNIPLMDLVFGLILAASTVLYPYGNGFQVDEFDRIPSFLMDFFQEGGSSSAKIPLYAGMTATFLSITRRGREVFGNQMLWVPFFCIVVNLSFIFLLDGVQYGNEQNLTDLNYIYHICHDILGTELGVLVFGLLIKNYVPLAQREEKV